MIFCFRSKFQPKANTKTKLREKKGKQNIINVTLLAYHLFARLLHGTDVGPSLRAWSNPYTSFFRCPWDPFKTIYPRVSQNLTSSCYCSSRSGGVRRTRYGVHAFLLIVMTLTIKTLRVSSTTNVKSLLFFQYAKEPCQWPRKTNKTNLQMPTRRLEGHAAAVRLTGKASVRMTWRWNRCPSCWSRSSAAWTGGSRTIGCSGPGSPWTCVWRSAATPWPPSATRTPGTKRSPTSRGTVGRTVPAKTPPSHWSSITSGTVFPANERATGRLKYGRLPNKN